MRNLSTFEQWSHEGRTEEYDPGRRYFLTGLAGTLGLGWVSVKFIAWLIRLLTDDYRSIGNAEVWASSLKLSSPSKKFLDKTYGRDKTYPDRLAKVQDMLKEQFIKLEDEENDLALTQKAYDAVVLAGVRVGPDTLSGSEFLEAIMSGDIRLALGLHEGLGEGVLPGDADKKAAEFERSLLKSGVRKDSDEPMTAGTGGGDYLRANLRRLGYSEKIGAPGDPGPQLTSAGDITMGLARAVSDVLARYKEAMPDVRVEITAGNDKHHRMYKRTLHNKGRAVDLTIYPYNDETSAAFLEVIRDYRAENPELAFKDEYRNPSRVATGPHYHLEYSGS